MESKDYKFNIIEDEEDQSDDATYVRMTSEHFLLTQKKKNEKKKSTGDLLTETQKYKYDEGGGYPHNSEYSASKKIMKENLKNSLVFKLKKNPNYATYLEKVKEKPDFLKEPKFLSKNNFESVVIASYQRSGWTLLRKYIENLTGILTGSDGDVYTELDDQIQDMGMIGQSIAFLELKIKLKLIFLKRI